MNKKIFTKLLAVMLVFTLTCANFILVATDAYKIYASAMEHEKQETAVTGTNIIFDSYFMSDTGEKTHSYVSEMENEKLKLYLDISVEKGYLESGIISITNSNFKLIETDEIIDGVEKISTADNTVTLNQISKGEKKVIELPIEVIKDETFNISYFSTDSNITFTGKFINDQAKETEFKKIILVNLSLSENAETTLSGRILNRAKFEEANESKEFIQLEIESGVIDNALPIRSTEIEIAIPELENRELEYTSVYATSTKATNGVNGNDFSKDNYTVKDGTIYLKVENNVDENGFISWSKESTDKYIVNLVYKLNDEAQDLDTLKLNIASKLNLYNSEEKIIDNNYVEEVSLEEAGNNIISVELNGDNEIAKGYMLLENSRDTEFKQNIEINIGYNPLIKEIDIKDLKEVYLDEKNKEYVASTYYKRISISKDNFEKILGTDGSITILKDDKEIGKIDIENLEFIFEEEISNIELKISDPKTEGKLEIEVEKYIKSSEYKADTVQKLTKLTRNIQMNTSLFEQETSKELELKETTLQAEMKVNPDNLSTVLENKNVELRIELKTSDNTQKLYKDPEIEIEFPSYINGIKINSVNLFYNEELMPDKAQLKTNKEGNKVLLLKIKGEQTKYNENLTVGGMTVVVDANLTIDSTAPSTTQKIISRITNNSEEKLEISENVFYSAPAGIITLNTVSDYNNEEEKVTSVSGVEKTGEIEKTAKTKIATETISVINNYGYTCGNMFILGRTPAEGNKNIKTNEDLGSTFTAKMVNGIKAFSGILDTEIEVYYSENPDATKELEDTNNGWVKEVESYELIKSYLIVVNKELVKGDKIELSYEIEIPEGLEKDESTYSMFEVYYTNLDGALNGVEEKAVSQVVGLATEQTADLDVKIKANVDDSAEVREGQLIEYTVDVTNKGKTEVKNAKMSVEIPFNAYYTIYEYFEDICTYDYTYLSDKVYEETIDLLPAGETKTYTFLLKVGKKNLDLEYEELNKIAIKATVKVENEEKEFESNEMINYIKEGTFSLHVISNQNVITLTEGTNIRYTIKINRDSSKEYENVEISTVLPKNLKYVKSSYSGIDKETESVNGSKITWKIDKLTFSGEIALECEIQNIDTSKENKVSFNVTGKCDGISEKVESNTEEFTAGKVTLEITTTEANKTDTLTNGDEAQYIITVKNVGNVTSYNTKINDYLTRGLNLKEIIVTYPDGRTQNYSSSYQENTILLGTLRPGETATAKIIVKANISSSSKGVTATHSYEVLVNGEVEEEKKEIAKYTIKPEVYEEEDLKVTTKKYSISGLAWEDENKDGLRQGDEKVLSQIPVLLLDEAGNSVDSTITNEDGTYIFLNLKTAKYMVVFIYDTANYDVTTYQAGDSSIDNDAIQMNLNIGNTNLLCGATNAITLNENIANIDLGLAVSRKFDLSLTKTITKITVNTAKGIKSYNYDNSLAQKIEIPSSEINGATLAIEYEIKVTNNGAVEGYAKRVVDYLSSTDLKFSSELNPDWYLGTDGNLYNSTMGETLLKQGEVVSLKLVLTKKLTETNTGITSNMAEIYESYNDEGIKDYNSTVANKAQSEDDLGHADVIIGIKTGVVLYIGIVLFTVAILTLGIYILNKKVIKI